MHLNLEADFAAMLADAVDALKAGEAADAERRAKAISALVRANRDVAEFVNEERTKAPETDEEELRAELRRRLARYVDAAEAGAADAVLEQIGTGAAAS